MFGFHHHHRRHGCGDFAFAAQAFRTRGFRPERSWESGGGRGRRVYDGDELRLVMLALIAEQPRHGYDLIREIEQRSGGAYAPSPGVVYPALTMLHEMAFLEELPEDGARKRFTLADTGRAHLEERRAHADALLARLAELGARHGGREGGAIKRAMVSLHMAVRGALEGDAADAQRIVDVLDEAVRRIERGDAA